MNFHQTGRGVEIPLTIDFDLAQTLECGQCFRWEKTEDGAFRGMVNGKAISIREDIDAKAIVLEGVSPKDFSTIWADYFDLDFDYAGARAQLCQAHPGLTPMAEFAPGIRLLRQDPWEALCSFILSQNNNIPRIKGIVQRLCEHFGQRTQDGFLFPTPERMAALTVEDLAPLRSGFRAKYLLSAAQLVSAGQVDLEALRVMPMEEARASLMQIVGVGPKVAECALLYGLHRLEAFPMDVWMKRAMEALFPGYRSEDFGEYAGIAQQYIFHYSRSNPKIFTDESSVGSRESLVPRSAR